MTRQWYFHVLITVAALLCTAILLFGLASVLLYQKLPPLDVLTEEQPVSPLMIYTADQTLIGEFGEERRRVVKLEAVPKALQKAILAAEDDRFYEHGGVDYSSVARAALANLSARGAREGASTITMQVARNYFLSKEKTISRKLNEALLAVKIEHSLSKNQILELYINHIYLGERSYGFAAASEIYFGIPMNQLSLAQMALLAGLPKAPSRDNPISNMERAQERQRYVLRRMRDLKYISEDDYESALKASLDVRPKRGVYRVQADYVSEMVRQQMYEEFGEAAYRMGLSVYTTLQDDKQNAAAGALRQGLLDYDRRHGYRGPEGHIDIPPGPIKNNGQVARILRSLSHQNGLVPAVVIKAGERSLLAHTLKQGDVTVGDEGLQFAREGRAKEHSTHVLQEGSVIWLRKIDNGGWEITQLPKAEAALVSINPKDGAVLALVGGFEYTQNKFNHVTQAMRQPGSCFKPFVYSAALEEGFTAATLVNDIPTEFVVPGSNGSKKYTPQNYDGHYLGRISFRTALAKSRNVASVSILNAIGVSYAQDYISRFGFSKEQVPPYLTMVLGVGSVTPLQVASAYAVFSNGGYRITPYLISRVIDIKGNILMRTSPIVAGENAERVIAARNAFIMTSIMQDVIQSGTGIGAKALGRHDLAGKTGSTTDYVDAWFAGFSPSLVAVSWVGFDSPHSLGKGEVGGRAALPIWTKYMAAALKNVPEEGWNIPEGITAVKENPKSNGAALVRPAYEFFYTETVPAKLVIPETVGSDKTSAGAED